MASTLLTVLGTDGTRRRNGSRVIYQKGKKSLGSIVYEIYMDLLLSAANDDSNYK